MAARFSFLRDRLRNSFWFTPALMTLGAVVLAVLTLTLDDHLSDEDLKAIPGLHTIVYSGGPDGAREVLGTIAASMITVAGVVFSITIVALTLASSQFGPRLLERFTRDRGNQLTLGTFIATFLYCLLVLRTIRTDQPESVPDVGVTVAVALAIAGLSVLIYFIHHVSMSIQAPSLVASIGGELRNGIHHLFPDADHLEDVEESTPPDLPDTGEARRVEARSSGYVQILDLEGLVALACAHDLQLRIEVRPGRFVVPSSTLAHAWPAARVTDELAADIAAALVTGSRRTPVQDVEFPIRQLAEVAVRSLSPGINDPFTASTCVDEMSVGLCEAAGRAFPPRALADPEGVVRVVIGDPVTFGRLIGVAFDQVRQCADFHAPVYVHLLEALTRIAGCVTRPERMEPLLTEGRLVMEAACASVPSEADRQGIEERYDELVTAASKG
ncbi:MAG TPA: DUF2254 domain-containing protein [Nocardioidaceae bacterium]|nr:DUF2254 domain-containing protein [Nocardioidaceae bacterium]